MDTCGLYYKHVTIVNYASSSVNKLRPSLNDDATVVIYDHHMFIVQATAVFVKKRSLFVAKRERSSLLRKGVTYGCKSYITLT
jgi:hypothetical protein